jgi:hypothetical protein
MKPSSIKYSIANREGKVIAAAAGGLSFLLAAVANASPFHALRTWENGETPGCTGTCVVQTSASGAFSPTHFYVLGVGGVSGFSSLMTSFKPGNGSRCTVKIRVRGAGTFATVPFKLEVIDEPSFNYIFNGTAHTVARDQPWTSDSAAFNANGNSLLVRATLLGQSGGSNVLVDDIGMDCT